MQASPAAVSRPRTRRIDPLNLSEDDGKALYKWLDEMLDNPDAQGDYDIRKYSYNLDNIDRRDWASPQKFQAAPTFRLKYEMQVRVSETALALLDANQKIKPEHCRFEVLSKSRSNRIGRGGQGVIYRTLGTLECNSESNSFFYKKNVARILKTNSGSSEAELSRTFGLGGKNKTNENDLLMHYLPGKTCYEYYRKLDNPRQKDAALRELITHFLRVARALKEIHAKNKVHHDLKPDNIMRLADGRITIIDFGSAGINCDYIMKSYAVFSARYGDRRLRGYQNFDLNSFARIFLEQLTPHLHPGNPRSHITEGQKQFDDNAAADKMINCLYQFFLDCVESHTGPDLGDIISKLEKLQITLIDPKAEQHYELGKQARADLKSKQPADIEPNSLQTFKEVIAEQLQKIPDDQPLALQAFLAGLDEVSLLACKDKQEIFDTIDEVQNKFNHYLEISSQTQDRRTKSISYSFSRQKVKQRKIISLDKMQDYNQRFHSILYPEASWFQRHPNLKFALIGAIIGGLICSAASLTLLHLNFDLKNFGFEYIDTRLALALVPVISSVISGLCAAGASACFFQKKGGEDHPAVTAKSATNLYRADGGEHNQNQQPSQSSNSFGKK